MIPGPTLVPERIVRAMSQPIIDHRGPRFAALVEACLEGLKGVFKTRNGHVILYPGSGTGAWEAALVLVDAVSSLASIDFRFDEWGVDVALTGPQKGLMLPPGMAILAASEKAISAGEKARSPRAYWDWRPVLERNKRGEYPYTPATMLLFGLEEALRMLNEEGLENVFRRHARLGEACRRAVRALGLALLCRDPTQYSNTLTAVVMPKGFDSDELIRLAYRRLELSLGVGLGAVKGRVFRIGHLGGVNELDLLGGLAGVEMALAELGVPVTLGAGLGAAQDFLLGRS